MNLIFHEKSQLGLDAALQKIDSLLEKNFDLNFPDISLASGLSGIAMYYCARISKFEDDLFERKLEKILEYIYLKLIRLTTLDIRFFSGLPGIGFALEQIALYRDGPTDAVASMNEDIDELVASSIPFIQNYDLVSGLVGVGVYALSRTKTSSRNMIFSLVYKSLIENSIETENGICWKTKPEYMGLESSKIRYPDGNFNLGLAHGVPGVVSLLSMAIDSEIQQPGLSVALRKATLWVLSEERKYRKSSYGYVSGDELDARIAWCYGDPGVALAIVKSGKSLNDQDIIQRGINIGLRATERLGFESGVNDHGICHGASGLALIYTELYYQTKVTKFKQAAKYWTNTVLVAIETEALVIDNVVNSGIKKIGLLEGISGIGISLILTKNFIRPNHEFLRFLLI